MATRGATEQLFATDIYLAGNTTILELAMLSMIVTLLVIGLIAAVLGFGGIAGASFALAKIIFFVMLILLLFAIVFGTIRRPIV